MEHWVLTCWQTEAVLNIMWLWRVCVGVGVGVGHVAVDPRMTERQRFKTIMFPRHRLSLGGQVPC